ncbi:hypothetical protein H696_06304, partial [Fonticula alba]
DMSLYDDLPPPESSASAPAPAAKKPASRGPVPTLLGQRAARGGGNPAARLTPAFLRRPGPAPQPAPRVALPPAASPAASSATPGCSLAAPSPAVATVASATTTTTTTAIAAAPPAGPPAAAPAPAPARPTALSAPYQPSTPTSYLLTLSILDAHRPRRRKRARPAAKSPAPCQVCSATPRGPGAGLHPSLLTDEARAICQLWTAVVGTARGGAGAWPGRFALNKAPGGGPSAGGSDPSSATAWGSDLSAGSDTGSSYEDDSAASSASEDSGLDEPLGLGARAPRAGSPSGPHGPANPDELDIEEPQAPGEAGDLGTPPAEPPGPSRLQRWEAFTAEWRVLSQHALAPPGVRAVDVPDPRRPGPVLAGLRRLYPDGRAADDPQLDGVPLSKPARPGLPGDFPARPSTRRGLALLHARLASGRGAGLQPDQPDPGHFAEYLLALLTMAAAGVPRRPAAHPAGAPRHPVSGRRRPGHRRGSGPSAGGPGAAGLPAAGLAGHGHPAAVGDIELDPANRGRRMLERMGWREGAGLGKQRQGTIVPVAEELLAVTGPRARDGRALNAPAGPAPGIGGAGLGAAPTLPGVVSESLGFAAGLGPGGGPSAGGPGRKWPPRHSRAPE